MSKQTENNFASRAFHKRLALKTTVLLDDVLLVPRADDKLIEAVGGVQLHNVPQNGHPAQLHHGLGLELGFFRDPGAEATGKNYDFHNVLNSSNVFAFSLIVFVS